MNPSYLLLLAAAALQAPDSTPPPLGKLVDIGGRRLHIHCVGSGSPTVITESGSSSFSIEWALVQDKVSGFARICSYDRAGFAWSDRGPAENTVEETMDDLHQLLRAAALKPPYVLVGHSIGGMYVQAYQRRYPDDVAGLVLVDATPEEDAEYLYNGKSTVGITLSYDQLASVYAPYIKNPPPPLELPTAVDTPYNKLSPELQRAEVWAERLWRMRVDLSHSWITAESWKQEFIALRQRRLAEPHALGDLPLIVLRRGRRTTDVLDQREAELVALSSIGKLVVATESDHEIQLYQPDLVVQAIRDVIGASHAHHGRSRNHL
ncbi:MAG TPA: alpha/beta hydrolase [Gemmatimonadales bacterium]|nr:alpha/beta hydrolase [Gemmatimonadales bacterium]